MKTTLTALAAAFALAVSLAGVAKPALAGDQHGDFMIRGLVTGVLPDSSATVFAGGSRIPGADAEASDEVIPAMTLTYFFTDNIAVELFAASRSTRSTPRAASPASVSLAIPGYSRRL